MSITEDRHPRGSVVSARNELRDCFLSDSRDRFEAAADAFRAEVLREAADAVAQERDGRMPVGGRGSYRRAMTRGVELLRRMADEAVAS